MNAWLATMPTWHWMLDGWIVTIAVLSAVACALVGNFLVLRRMSMMGDAISHAVLPGLAVAFLLFGSRGSLAMFLGAVAAGLLTALFTQTIHAHGKVDEGASMGVVFTALFAVGLILIVRAMDHVDLDPGCVLYGAIELAPLHRIEVFGMHVPRAAATLAPVLLVNVVIVLLFYKELRISSFDPALASTMGINATAMHYLLMTLVAVTTVAAFEAVGSILVIAMLIVPGAAAHLLTDRLHTMLLASVLFAALSAVLGHIGAITVPVLFGFDATSTSGMMAVAAGLLFGLVMFGAPRHGVLSRALRQARHRLRIAREDVLGVLYRLEELRAADTPDAGMVRSAIGAGPLLWHVAIVRLRRAGLIEDADGLRLTDRGRLDGRHLIRSHRLWERFLHRSLQLPADHVHDTAERLEHVTDPDMARELARDTDREARDPQGRRIP